MAHLKASDVQKFLKASYEDLYNNKILITVDTDDYHNIHFVFEGWKDTAYEGGYYYGMFVLHDDHPYKAPSQYMLSPSGRFVYAPLYPPTADYAICTSQTGFHQDTWSPQSNFGQYLIAWVSMFPEDSSGIGGIRVSDKERKTIAKTTKAYLLKCNKFKEIFPDFHKALKNDTNPFPSINKTSSSVKKIDVKSKMQELGLDSDSENEKHVISSPPALLHMESKKKSSKKSSKKIYTDSEDSESEHDIPKKKSSKKKIDSDTEDSSSKKKSSKKKIDSDSEHDIPKKKSSKKRFGTDSE